MALRRSVCYLPLCAGEYAVLFAMLDIFSSLLLAGLSFPHVSACQPACVPDIVA